MQEQKDKQVIIANGELVSIKERLSAIETENRVRWNNHDQRSVEIWGRIEQQMIVLFKKVDYINERISHNIETELKDSEKRKIQCSEESKKYTNKLIAFALGIPASIASFLGLIFYLINGGKK